MAGSNKLSFLTCQWTVIYDEVHGKSRLGDLLEWDRNRVLHRTDRITNVNISKLYEFDGLNKVDVEEANIGSIVAISGIADIHIGDTL